MSGCTTFEQCTILHIVRETECKPLHRGHIPGTQWSHLWYQDTAPTIMHHVRWWMTHHVE